MARRKRTFGSPPKEHLRDAVAWGRSFRVEKRVILQHLRRGECHSALRGLVMAGYADAGRQVNKDASGKRRSKRGRLREGNAPATHLLHLADRVAHACGVENYNKTEWERP